eukprot:GAHX01000100.1.p1 GENE.GAHX01000100.1~~GAHX01000100.1.p1  ORF type:complete len:425 (+),score=76.54 GAHX01000100.1:739-2013(+)
MASEDFVYNNSNNIHEISNTKTNVKIQSNYLTSDPAIHNKDNKVHTISFCDGRFEVVEKLGCGSFGYIFRVLDNNTNKQYAAKIENRKSRGHNLLAWEYSVYHAISSSKVFPSVVWYGLYGKRSVLIMDLFGPDLDHTFSLCEKKFSLKTVLMIGKQLLNSLEQLHTMSYVHRDLKPANIVTGEDGELKLIDFGLTRQFKDKKTNIFYPPMFKNSMAGTPRFASIAAHNGTTQSPKDDLESFVYILIYFLKGKLPWQSLKVGIQGRCKQIELCKKNTPTEILCGGLPREFSEILVYVKGLSFYNMPNYEYLHKIVDGMMSKNKWDYDWKYDWLVSNESGNTNVDVYVDRVNRDIDEGKSVDFCDGNYMNENKHVGKSNVLEEVMRERDFYKEKCTELDFKLRKVRLEVEALNMQIDVYKKMWRG